MNQGLYTPSPFIPSVTPWFYMWAWSGHYSVSKDCIPSSQPPFYSIYGHGCPQLSTLCTQVQDLPSWLPVKAAVTSHSQKLYLVKTKHFSWWLCLRFKALKVPEREIFHRSDFPDFYTIKSLRVGDFGVKTKLKKKIFRGSFRGAI
jgi:hypothetical protein